MCVNVKPEEPPAAAVGAGSGGADMRIQSSYVGSVSGSSSVWTSHSHSHLDAVTCDMFLSLFRRVEERRKKN